VLEALDSNVDGPNPQATSLAGGRAGLAVFFAYLARSRGRTHSRVATTLLDEAASALATTEMSPSLHGGFTGIAWACSHLWNGKHDADPNAEVDEALIQYLGRSPWTDHYDLIGGLVGLDVYALEQRPHPRADMMLAQVLDRLAELAQPSGGGLTWHTGPSCCPLTSKRSAPTATTTSASRMACRASSRCSGWRVQPGTRSERARCWSPPWAQLLEQRLDPSANSVFPVWTAPGYHDSLDAFHVARNPSICILRSSKTEAYFTPSAVSAVPAQL
jgi:hypothetical protein